MSAQSYGILSAVTDEGKHTSLEHSFCIVYHEQFHPLVDVEEKAVSEETRMVISLVSTCNLLQLQYRYYS